jgi:flagellar biosynthesis activator protein FlaF
MTSPSHRYQRIPEPGNAARTEAWALIEAARELHESRSDSLDRRRTALRRNWRLWTIFQASLLDPACELPAAIRSNLLGLANFIDRHTAELLAHGDAAKIDVLVNINRQISEGLLDGQRSGAAAAAAPARTAVVSLVQNI